MTVAALNCRLLTLTSYKANVEFKLQRILERRQYLSYQTMEIAETKCAAMQAGTCCEEFQAQVEAQEEYINGLDKIFEMDQTNLQTQLQEVTTEVDSIQKLLDNNIKKEFKLNA